MLQIRKEQMATFGSSLREQADQALVKYAMMRFPTEFPPFQEAKTREFVAKIRATAKQYGVEKENDVATFLDFTVMYGADFPIAPWAEDVLSCGGMHGPDKMALLRFRVQETGVRL
jgi:hypothetical protein